VVVSHKTLKSISSSFTYLQRFFQLWGSGKDSDSLWSSISSSFPVWGFPRCYLYTPMREKLHQEIRESSLHSFFTKFVDRPNHLKCRNSSHD